MVDISGLERSTNPQDGKFEASAGEIAYIFEAYGETFLSTGSGRHSDAAHEIHLIGCCVLLKVVLKNVPHSGSSQMLSVDWHRSKRCIYFLFVGVRYTNWNFSDRRLQKKKKKKKKLTW